MNLYPEPPAWKSWDAPAPGIGLFEWQADRCAWCGTDRGQLVEDHCHATGLLRGLLCRSCNQAEGAGREVWAGWRNGDHPARAVGHIEVYANHFGRTPLHPTATLSYYTATDRDAWWVEICEALAEGAPWPTEAPWTPKATARREAELVELREAVFSLPSAESGAA